MYIIDGIAYAGEPSPPLKVCGVRPLDNHLLWLRFSTGEEKIFDFKPLLGSLAFLPLANEEQFKSIYIDYGVPTWMDGALDLDPHYLYENAITQDARDRA